MRTKVWFIRRPGLRWSVLRLLLNSPWEDVAIEVSGYVYAVDRVEGVVRYELDQFHRKYLTKTWTMLNVPDDARIEFYLDNQLGKPMDSSVVFPYSPLRRWSCSERWYSGELVTKALMFGNALLYPEVGRVTPRKLWSLLPTVVVTG